MKIRTLVLSIDELRKGDCSVEGPAGLTILAARFVNLHEIAVEYVDYEGAASYTYMFNVAAPPQQLHPYSCVPVQLAPSLYLTYRIHS